MNSYHCICSETLHKTMERTPKKRTVNPSFAIWCPHPEKATSQLLDRFAMCRAAGCCNVVWETEEIMKTDGSHAIPTTRNQTRIRFAGLDNLKFTITLGKSKPGSSFKSRAHDGPKREVLYNTCITKDAQAFEELYISVHHIMSGPCALKHGSANTPMSRLDAIEARLEDMLQLITAPDLLPGEVRQPDGESKRRKIEAISQ